MTQPITLRVDSSGAILLPEHLRTELGLVPGAEIQAVLAGNAIFLRSTSPPVVTEKPVWEHLLNLAQQVPDEELDRIPRDLSMQIDHYVYGTPKKLD